MNQIDRYILQILNLSSRDIASIESYHDENGHIIAYIMPVSKIKDCPYCGSTHIVSKGYRKDRFITPTNNSSTCKIIFSLKRYQCRTCNHSFSERAIMAPSYAKLSYQTIMKIMDLLLWYEKSFFMAMKVVRFNCCGMNVHKDLIVATVGITDRKTNITEYFQRSFSTLNCDLYPLKDWLKSHHC